jgi:hypothetical protein
VNWSDTALSRQAARMKRYKSRTAGKTSTNWRNAERIRQHLEDSDTVLIYALSPDPGHRFHDLDVDLAKGLENPLIARFQPEWNH